MALGAWVALLFCIIAGGAVTLAAARRAGVVLPTLAGLAAQGLICVALYAAVGLWAPDSLKYDLLGQEFAAHWRGGPVPSQIGEGKEGFPLMLGAVYFVVGHAPMVGLALNWIGHGLLIPVLASLAKRLELPATPVAWMVALFPPSLFWSGLLLRESITWLLLALFLYAVIGIARRITVRDVAIMIAALAILLWFRGTAAIILTTTSMIVLMLTSNRRTFAPRLGIATISVLVLSPRLTSLFSGYTSVEEVQSKRDSLGRAGTGFEPDAVADPAPEPATTTDGGGDGLASSLIDSFLRVTFGPYPWEWPSIGAPFALDAILWLAILGFAGLGCWQARRRKEMLLLVLPALAFSAALMLTSGNYGTMQRLRVQTSILLIPVAAAGLSLMLTKMRVPRKRFFKLRTRRA